jgi:uncharacterized membrane protein YhiD involved in acid resistance
VFSIGDVMLSMTVSALLCFMLAHVYRETHRGTSYSQSFLITMLLLGVSVSIVMMIIGSNIARAFSLVGALSIIRFRTAVKDPRDTGFLFAAMIAGMGCGTQFYMPAIALTLFVSVLVLALYHFDYGVKQRLELILQVTSTDREEIVAGVERELGDSYSSFKRINRILDFGDGNVTNVYVVKPAKRGKDRNIEARLKNVEGVIRLAMYESDQHGAL